MLEGFPPDAVNEEEIANFVCSSVLHQEREALVKVVIGYDVRHFEENRKQQENLEAMLRRSEEVRHCL